MDMPTITIIDQCKIRISAFTCQALGRVSQKTMDMTPYAGQRVRIWLDRDGSYAMDPRQHHFWQVAELNVPEIRYQRPAAEDGEMVEDDSPPAPLPVDLTGVEIQTWSLPA